jgi:spermidine dehydrogenase
MRWSRRDRELGMDRPIARRDFLNGAAMAVVGAGAVGALGGVRPAHAAAAAYPPALTGYRGHHAGSWEVMHGVADGSFWASAGSVAETGERYDLVVVGGGISGLAAAFEYRRRAPGARVLILDSHDDFGGHAKRNEFTTRSGRTLIGYGGSQSMQTPSYWTPAVKEMIAAIGIDTDAFKTFYDEGWAEARGLAGATFFTREGFGTDRLVRRGGDAKDWVPQAPLSEAAKAQLIELIDSPPDYLAGKTRAEKLEILARTTYAEFLTGICGYDPSLVTLYQNSTTGYFGVGIDACTALDAWANWNPGFAGMDLGENPSRLNSPSGRLALTDPDPYIFHFPDGNAGIARALVRAMIPEALAGEGMVGLTLAQVDYGALDRAANPVRLRLSATAVRVRHEGMPTSAPSVEVVYAKDGALHRVSAGHVVLACWHRVIPKLTDELPPEQVDALNDQQRVPLCYTNVVLADWKAFDRLRIEGFRAPGHPLLPSGFEIDFPVSMGAYRFAQTPDEPIVLHNALVAVKPGSGLSTREQSMWGRQMLYETSFETFERAIRDLLARALSDGGFDPARDIEAITVNRWAHGYAYEYMRPWDTFWPDGELPAFKARRPWGRIAIANSDSGAYAYAHSAIDQAVRAVRDLLGAPEGAPAFADFPGPPRDMLRFA